MESLINGKDKGDRTHAYYLNFHGTVLEGGENVTYIACPKQNQTYVCSNKRGNGHQALIHRVNFSQKHSFFHNLTRASLDSILSKFSTKTLLLGI